MHEALVKEAVIGAVASGIGRFGLGTGKWVAKNPMKSLGVGFTALDVSTAGAAGARRAAESAARNMSSTISHIGPTF
jgi:hypothetical protein